jgi:transcriptional regulator with XRE-family HTH domain
LGFVAAAIKVMVVMTKSTYSKSYRKLCVWLVEARKRLGITQHELAVKLGKPQSYVSKYERGERRLDVVEFIEITETLGLDPIEILERLKREDV